MLKDYAVISFRLLIAAAVAATIMAMTKMEFGFFPWSLLIAAYYVPSTFIAGACLGIPLLSLLHRVTGKSVVPLATVAGVLVAIAVHVTYYTFIPSPPLLDWQRPPHTAIAHLLSLMPAALAGSFGGLVFGFLIRNRGSLTA